MNCETQQNNEEKGIELITNTNNEISVHQSSSTLKTETNELCPAPFATLAATSTSPPPSHYQLQFDDTHNHRASSNSITASTSIPSPSPIPSLILSDKEDENTEISNVDEKISKPSKESKGSLLHYVVQSRCKESVEAYKERLYASDSTRKSVENQLKFTRKSIENQIKFSMTKKRLNPLKTPIKKSKRMKRMSFVNVTPSLYDNDHGHCEKVDIVKNENKIKNEQEDQKLDEIANIDINGRRKTPLKRKPTPSKNKTRSVLYKLNDQPPRVLSKASK